MESSDEPAATASPTEAAPAIAVAGASPPTLPPTDDALPASDLYVLADSPHYPPPLKAWGQSSASN